MSHFVITGATGGAPNRLEVHDFIKNEKYFSLFIQALRAMHNDNQDNLQSFFSVGKVHGLPYRVWDGAVGDQPWDPNTTFGGYCTHGSVLFPTWHRPYVVLYEQIIQSNALKIAKTYTVDQYAWVQAANELRHPYWDWAVNSVPPDEIIALKKVTIIGPHGKKVTVDNPIYHYAFHPVDPSFPAPYSAWKTTLRHPTTQDSNAKDNVAQMKSVLRASQSDITSSIYHMLTRVHDWAAFSNHTVGDGGSTSNSLEAIHDGIHFDIGGGGQMSDPGVAGFDPIFFFLHCNVDRMLQLWAALNPGVWVSPNDSEDGTFTIPAETPVDANTPLTPFWNSQTSFWASNGTQDMNSLGYSYPDFDGLDLGNAEAVRIAIANRVNKLYGSSVFSSLAGVPPTAAISAFSVDPIQLAPVSEGNARGPQTTLSAHTASPNHALYDWTARIEVKKYELGCSYAVLLFLGGVPDDDRQWLVSPNLVGKYQTFVNTSASQCANCSTQKDVVTEGFVHLTQAILKHSGLDSLERNVVEPYLTENLQWRVLKANCEPATLPSLEVSVYVTPLSYPPGTVFPVPGERTRCNGVTYDREGGSREPLV